MEKVEKRYTMAGVSTLRGELKVRVANDASRIKILEKNGHKDIDLIDLPYAMTKSEIADYLTTIEFADGREEVAKVIAEMAKKYPLTEAEKTSSTVAEEA